MLKSKVENRFFFQFVHDGGKENKPNVLCLLLAKFRSKKRRRREKSRWRFSSGFVVYVYKGTKAVIVGRCNNHHSNNIHPPTAPDNQFWTIVSSGWGNFQVLQERFSTNKLCIIFICWLVLKSNKHNSVEC